MTDQQGLEVQRYFVPHGDPYATVEWVRANSKITDKDGNIVFQMNDIEVPKGWSQTAIDIVASKYFRKAGVPTKNGETGPETSVRQVVNRLANTWHAWGQQHGYFADVGDGYRFREEIVYMLLHQMAAPNSPQWFNTGLFEEYGISGPPQGHYTTDPKFGEAYPSPDAYSRPQTSACFIQPIDDDLVNEGGIMDLWLRESRIFKYGSGTGTNFSAIRGKGEPLSGGGTSSGLISFLRVGDRAAGAIKSGGTTRRAAKMCVLDIDHPDIEEFIDWKLEEEKKAHALIAAGYPADFNGPAYDTISGQNSNNSVRVTNDFMKRLSAGDEWFLSYRTNVHQGRYVKTLDLWNKIANSAWHCADPGVQYDTTINEWHTVPNSGRINASNPCSEFVFLDNTACNLASLNLVKFYNEETKVFDVTGFTHAVRLWTIVLEISVLMSQFPSQEIARNSYDFRPLGLGYANLGALLMRRGIPYDSDEGRNYAAVITALMTGEAYRTSAEMARELGAFAKFHNNKNEMIRVLTNHARALYPDAERGGYREYEGLTKLPYQPPYTELDEDIRYAAKMAWDEALELGNMYGYRNAQTTLLAPTGTIGLLMDCDTTGVEPDFSLVKYKKLAGGGTMKLVNQSVRPALQSLGYTQEWQDEIINDIDKSGTIMGCAKINPSHQDVFYTANEIRPRGHLLMMAAVQPFLSGAISKTINLPNMATVEDIEGVYYDGWTYGLKAVALYRDGSKLSAPLSTTDQDKKGMYTEADLQAAVAEARNEARIEPPGSKRYKLSAKRSGITHEFSIGGQKVYLRTGEYPDGSLGEIFIDIHKEGAALRSVLNCFAIMVSKGLQHGVPLEELVETFAFTKFEPHGIVSGHPNLKMAGSIIDAVFRILAYEYLGITDMVQNPGENVQKTLEDITEYYNITVDPDGASISSNGHKELVRVPIIGSVTANAPQGENRVTAVMDAPLCNECGHITTRNGTCFKCDNCGTTTGCS